MNYIQEAGETSSVAIVSQTLFFDPKWPWLFQQIRQKRYDTAPESASSSPLPINHGSSFHTWKPTEGSYNPQADKVSENEWFGERRVSEEVAVFYNLLSSFDALHSACDNEVMLSAWTRPFSHAF